AGHRAHGEGDARRSREGARSGLRRLRLEAHREREAVRGPASLGRRGEDTTEEDRVMSTSVAVSLPREPTKDLGKVDILLVDDHPQNLVALQAMLADFDYRLVSVTSGEEALAALLREDFAVVLLDVVMPGMDGFEVASHMKALERTRRIPIIFLTA